ncbi:MAG: hypothetical protein Q9227_000221 [Pyrenula ochraceoflavens]
MPHPSSAGVVELVKKWYDECFSNHVLCRDQAADSQSSFPTRVIEVGGEDNMGIHILEVGDETLEPRGSYVALSHCWGQSRHLVSERSTIANLKLNIPWTKLPRTFQDAIAITRDLGIQYIWIDSLCIIQDDLMDWESEAEKMGAVYSNAALVIAATASLNGNGGLLFSRSGHIAMKGMDQNQNAFQIFVRHGLNHGPFTWGPGAENNMYRRHGAHLMSFPGYPLFTRAWCFQERLLGPRVLHFTKDEIVYECITGINCECGSLTDFSEEWLLPSRRHVASYLGKHEKNGFANPALGSSLFSTNESIIGRLPELTIPYSPLENNPLLEWRALVAEYSAKSISRSSDWLPALAGLASIWHEAGAGHYLAGIWSQDLLRSLLWRAVTPEQTNDIGSISPSWSWVSVGGLVTWLSPSAWNSVYFIEIDMHKSGVSLKGRNLFGEVTNGWLFLSGFVAEVTLADFYADDQSKPFVHLKVRGKTQHFDIDSLQRISQLSNREALWLKYCEDGGHERALVLAPVQKENLSGLPLEIQMFPTVYRRIGVVQYADKNIELPETRKVSMYIV